MRNIPRILHDAQIYFNRNTTRDFRYAADVKTYFLPQLQEALGDNFNIHSTGLSMFRIHYIINDDFIARTQSIPIAEYRIFVAQGKISNIRLNTTFNTFDDVMEKTNEERERYDRYLEAAKIMDHMLAGLSDEQRDILDETYFETSSIRRYFFKDRLTLEESITRDGRYNYIEEENL